MALPDVGTFHFALFECEDSWHHRLCLGHTLRGAVIAPPDGDAYVESWADYSSYLLAGPTGGLPDGLRGRMLYRFHEDDMATGSPFWNTVQRGAATPLLCGLHETPTLLWIAHGQFPRTSLLRQLHLVLAGVHWKTQQYSRLEMPSPVNLTTSFPHVDCGSWSLVEASLSQLRRQGWHLFKLSLRNRMCAPCQYALTLVASGPVVCGCCPQDGRTRPERFPNPRTADDALASTGDCQRGAGTGGASSLVEASNGALIIGPRS